MSFAEDRLIDWSQSPLTAAAQQGALVLNAVVLVEIASPAGPCSRATDVASPRTSRARR